MTIDFIHLDIHSEYSLADGTVRIAPLVECLAGNRMPAAALTDLANLFGMVKFYRAAAAAGIKPLIGVDVQLVDERAAGPEPGRILLYCRNDSGYRSLCRLLSRAYLDPERAARAVIHAGWLQGEADDLMAVVPAGDNPLVRDAVAGTGDGGSLVASRLMPLFEDRLYTGISRIGRPGEHDENGALVDFSNRNGLAVVALNEVRFLNSEDFDAHEVRVCINEGRQLGDPRRKRRYTAEQYLKSPAQMRELFEDQPFALDNTVEFARRCNFALDFGKSFLPAYPEEAGGLGEADLLSERSRHRLGEYTSGFEDSRAANYVERLDVELGVINSMGYAGYFLIVADFIQWARDNGIPVGPGRGSGAGSLVAFFLGITDLDPIVHGLLFERFLNPERVSLPDFDIDFCMEGRDRVIEYVAGRYGRDKVAQIITFGTMAARAVVRDVGRVLGMPYGQVDAIAKLIPFEIGMTLDKAMAEEEQLRERYDQEEELRELIDMARSLEGLARNVGKHAGGVVIAPSELTRFSPLFCEQGSTQPVTQLDKDDLETMGLVKFDFLGLRTLTIIDKCVAYLNRDREPGGDGWIDLEHLPMEDEATFGLLRSCRTTALFQLESRGMTELVQRLKPDKFDDLVALVALYRPGPLQSGMVDDFVQRKHGKEMIRYPHPDVEAILETTYGVILYQEQVMKIAQVLAGYSLGSADLLRRAMGKKKAEEMAMQRQAFVDGAAERGVDVGVATHIFDLMEKFAGYGFNKSHSAAYALITYQTSWLKAHFPAAFLAASMSADLDNTDKVVVLIAECARFGIEVVPPDVNLGEYEFVPAADDRIVYGLGAIKGVGRQAIDSVVAERQKNGPYTDLLDFCERQDGRRINRRVVESLIKAGALDGLGADRPVLLATLGQAMDIANQKSVNDETGQDDLFGMAGDTGHADFEYVACPPWSDEERLRAEKETLGLYLSGHPFDAFRGDFEGFSRPLAELSGNSRETIVAGLVMGIRTRNTRRGERMAFVTLDDGGGRLDIIVPPDLYAAHRDVIRADNMICMEGECSIDDFNNQVQMRAREVWPIERVYSHSAVELVVYLGNDHGALDIVNEAVGTLSADGRCRLRFVCRLASGIECELVGAGDMKCDPSIALVRMLRANPGIERVKVKLNPGTMNRQRPTDQPVYYATTG